ncbi:MAG TPA: Fic family protein, partial [Pseudonocardiaceae bacterium]|nr:Fic family protein [Pseudonocardiaceae bacterium]
MAKVVRHRWDGEWSAPSRRDRQPCTYEAYVPDPLVGRKITLDGDVAADVADAEAAVARLDAEATALTDTEVLARLLLRAESVASSRIEGLEVGPRRLLRAEVARQTAESAEFAEPAVDVTAGEVLANVDAMTRTVQSTAVGEPITLDHILDFHRRLLAGSGIAEYAGQIRTEQNWIGGSDYNPCSAAFVPPPPELVEELLSDLCAFCNDDGLPVVAQAAIAHAQFETIHPFADGNGRTGRALIHLVMRRRALTSRVLLPVSLVLATWSRDYIDGLVRTRYNGPATSSAAHEGINIWIGRFAGACSRAVDDANLFEQRSQDIQRQWRARLGTVRRGSAVDLLLPMLVGTPIITAGGAATLIGRSFPQTNQAISRLVAAGILAQVTVGRRNRAFEAPEVIAAFTD